MAKRWLPVVVTLLLLVGVILAATIGRDALVSSGVAEKPATEASTAEEPTAAQDDDVERLADHDATVYTDQGEPVLLSDIAAGRPLVINFWATWCPYCVDEMPDFQQIHAEYADRVSFAFVDAADGYREHADDAAEWLVAQGFEDLPAYYDTQLEAVKSFGIYSYPTTIVVDADGKILDVSPGRIDAVLMRATLESALSRAAD